MSNLYWKCFQCELNHKIDIFHKVEVIKCYKCDGKRDFCYKSEKMSCEIPQHVDIGEEKVRVITPSRSGDNLDQGSEDEEISFKEPSPVLKSPNSSKSPEPIRVPSPKIPSPEISSPPSPVLTQPLQK